MTVKIVFWNMRGGSGKSTLALELARELLRRKKTVGIVDKDPYIQNSFPEIKVSSLVNENWEYNIIDCPPVLTVEIETILKDANVVIIPRHSCIKIDFEETISQICDPLNTYIVPTVYAAEPDQEFKSRFPMTRNKLKWGSLPGNESLHQVSQELADSIVGLSKSRG